MNDSSSTRLLSLDVMRGGIMVLLMLESTLLFDRLLEATGPGLGHSIAVQLTHHTWNGLHFWDLIQPCFMFIAGAALAFSQNSQQRAGVLWRSSLARTVRRAVLLFFWGVLIYAVRPRGLSFELWNVLTQLSVTTLITFLIFRWPVMGQFIFSLGLLVLIEILYRFMSISGFDQPFTDQHNFGNYIDILLMNKTSAGGWVAINCIPTACHTIWGALAGKLLFSKSPERYKMRWLLLTGIAALITGFVMGHTITPIIKRIATSSFVFVSAGWCLLGLALLYWWIDIKGNRKHLHYILIVGMNSLFIYLFFETIGIGWLNGFLDAITFGLLGAIRINHALIGIISSLVTFYLELRLCQFLYEKRIYIKI